LPNSLRRTPVYAPWLAEPDTAARTRSTAASSKATGTTRDDGEEDLEDGSGVGGADGEDEEVEASGFLQDEGAEVADDIAAPSCNARVPLPPFVAELCARHCAYLLSTKDKVTQTFANNRPFREHADPTKRGLGSIFLPRSTLPFLFSPGVIPSPESLLAPSFAYYDPYPTLHHRITYPNDQWKKLSLTAMAFRDVLAVLQGRRKRSGFLGRRTNVQGAGADVGRRSCRGIRAYERNCRRRNSTTLRLYSGTAAEPPQTLLSRCEIASAPERSRQVCCHDPSPSPSRLRCQASRLIPRHRFPPLPQRLSLLCPISSPILSSPPVFREGLRFICSVASFLQCAVRRIRQSRAVRYRSAHVSPLVQDWGNRSLLQGASSFLLSALLVASAHLAAFSGHKTPH
jgi:hypothetical protein